METDTLCHTRSARVDMKPLLKAIAGQKPENTYAIHLLIIPEEDGKYSAVALNLPGSGSCGDTKAEAIENAKEAVKGVLESYKESGEPIPWKNTADDETPGEKEWITVHA
jgi:antitoxin HicB